MAAKVQPAEPRPEPKKTTTDNKPASNVPPLQDAVREMRRRLNDVS